MDADADAVADAAAAAAAARRIWGSLGLGLVFVGGSLIVSKRKAAQKFNRLFRGHGMMPWEMFVVDLPAELAVRKISKLNGNRIG